MRKHTFHTMTLHMRIRFLGTLRRPNLFSTTCNTVGHFSIGWHTGFQGKLLYLHSAKHIFSAILGLNFYPKVHRSKWSHFPLYFELKTAIMVTDNNRGYCCPWHLDWLQKYWSCNRGYWCPWHLEWLQKYWSCNWLKKWCERKGYVSLNHLSPFSPLSFSEVKQERPRWDP